MSDNMAELLLLLIPLPLRAFLPSMYQMATMLLIWLLYLALIGIWCSSNLAK